MLIPYKKGNLWGFADTTGKVIVIPEYTKVGYTFLKKKLFLVERGEKKGLVDESGDLLIPVLYERFSIKKYFISAIRSGKAELFSIEGKKILDSDYRSFKMLSHLDSVRLVHVETLSGRHGVLEFQSDPTLYPELILDTIYNRIRYHDSEVFVCNFGENKFVNPFSNNEELGFETRGSLQMDDTVIENGITHDSPSSEYQRWTYSVFPIEKDGHKKILHYRSTKGNTYREKDTIDMNFQEALKMDFKWFNIYRDSLNERNIQYSTFYRVKNDFSKYGIINFKGELSIPMIYDEIDLKVIQSSKYDLLSFRCRKGSKWGMITINNKVLIDFDYDQLILRKELTRNLPEESYLSGNWSTTTVVVRRGDKFGVINRKNIICVPIEMDKIVFLPNGFGLQKQGKWGFMAFEGGLPYVDPKFDLMPIGHPYILPRAKYLQLVNKDGTTAGYANTSGLLFFD